MPHKTNNYISKDQAQNLANQSAYFQRTFPNGLRLGDGYEALALCGGVACAKPLLCSRCGISALNFNRRNVFLIFFLCGGFKILALKISTL